jgi:hypothetical protein
MKNKSSVWEDTQWLKGLGLSGSQVKYIMANVKALLESKESHTIQRIRNFNFGELGTEMERYIYDSQNKVLRKITKWAKDKKHIYPATELKDAGYDITNADNNWDAEGSRMLGNIEGYNDALFDLREFVIELGREKIDEEMEEKLEKL